MRIGPQASLVSILLFTLASGSAAQEKTTPASVERPWTAGPTVAKQSPPKTGDSKSNSRQVAPAASSATLKDGTPLILKTLDDMVSGRTPKGSTVNYRVERDVCGPDGRILIPAGAVATGKVTVSEGHGIFGREGKLDITLESAIAADGTVVPLRAVRTATGENAHDLVIGGALLVSVFFVLFSGHNVEVPAGTLMNAFVNGQTVVARPLPAKMSPAELAVKRTLSLVVPGLPQPVQKEDKLVFSCSLNPPDDNAYLRLYVDDKLVCWQKGNLGKIEWVAESLEEGEHSTHLEATYSNGFMVDSGITKFQLKD